MFFCGARRQRFSLSSCRTLVFVLILLGKTLYADIVYEVRLEGMPVGELREALKANSTLVSLVDKPPPTLSALQHRADEDIAALVEILHSFSYYDAHIDPVVQPGENKIIVILAVSLGQPYLLDDVNVVAEVSRTPLEEDIDDVLATISPCMLGFRLATPLLASDVIYGRDAVVRYLARQGYPLAKIAKEDVFVDVSTKRVHVVYHVASGPAAVFGPLEIRGLRSVRPCVLQREILWRPGCRYDPRLVERTECGLQETQLFNYVCIHHGETVDEDGRLPITVEVLESKHRSVGLGGSYSTQQGAGVSGEWEHRNVSGLGRTFGVNVDLLQKLQKAAVAYRIPHFCARNQELLWVTEAKNEQTLGYDDSSVSISGIVEIHYGKKIKLSYGGSLKQMHSLQPHHRQDFTLFKTPFQYDGSTTDDILNPTRGTTLQYKLIPTTQLLRTDLAYLDNHIVVTYYHPFLGGAVVLAEKVVVGAIFGPGRDAIPAPERYYAGNENTLRGYRYMTVSPLNEDEEPIGGRSILVGSVELRVRCNQHLGWAAFYEVGNVYANMLPRFPYPQLQSVGFGFRYFTDLGPLRADIAFPLNRRHGLDEPLQFYLSIGQAF